MFSKEGRVRDSEWKHLHPQELWEGEKINKGKCSRAIEVNHGQRREWEKGSSYAKGKQMKETLRPRGPPAPAVRTASSSLTFSRTAVPPNVKQSEQYAARLTEEVRPEN